jgi:hypothetical protein
VATLVAVQVASCYRAEIDLAPLADAAGTGNDHPSGASAHAAGGSSAGGDGGQAAEPGGNAGSAGSDNPAVIPPCEDTPLSAEDQACALTGLKKTAAECNDQVGPPAGWQGCYNGGCAVCTLRGELPGYPHYFDWHRCCSMNDTCSNHDPRYCNALCPPPTEHDKVAPCGRSDPNPG